jgi:hypothetical protein
MGTQIPVWVTWNSRIKLWAAVTYGAGGSVNNTITSTDGDTWSPTISSTYRFQRIHNNGAMFLGMDDNGKAPDYSYDGKTWFSGGAITGGPFLRNGWAAWNGSIWLTVGIGGAGNPHGSATSPDGLTWTRTTGILDQGYHVMWNGSVWIAGGKYYSADNGATWTLCQGSYPTTAIGVQTSSIAMPATSTTTGALVVSGGAGIGGNTYIGGTLFANGTAPQNAYNMVMGTSIGFFTSTDTFNWTLRNNTVMSGVTPLSVKWNGYTWLAIAKSGTNTTATSPDGITWTGRGNTTPNALPNTCIAISVAYSPPLDYWIAMTYSTNTSTANVIYRSTDRFATSWSVLTGSTTSNGNTQSPCVVWSSRYSRFFFSNYAGVNATYNGSAWATLSYGLGSPMFINADGPYILVGTQTGGNINYSTNGTSFTTSTFIGGALDTNCRTISMAFNGSVFVACFDKTPWMATSADYGITWTINTVISFGFATIIWNGTYFVGTSSGTNFPRYSTDGINWTNGATSSNYTILGLSGNDGMNNTGIGAALFAAPAISTSTSTGGLVVSGGAGIGGNLNVGGIIETFSTAVSTSTTTGALQVIGGAGIVGNVYVGGNIIMTNVNNNSTRFGYLALNSGTGSNNTAFGASALNSNNSANNNTAVGASALTLNTGSGNTGVGNSAGSSISTGINNTVIGSSAGGANLTTSGNITLLGANTSLSATTWTASTAIGYNASITASNQIVLGTASESVSIIGTAASTSTTTGALVVGGGVGIVGNVNVGGGANFTVGVNNAVTISSSGSGTSAIRLENTNSSGGTKIVAVNGNNEFYISGSGTNYIGTGTGSNRIQVGSADKIVTNATTTILTNTSYNQINVTGAAGGYNQLSASGTSCYNLMVSSGTSSYNQLSGLNNYITSSNTTYIQYFNGTTATNKLVIDSASTNFNNTNMNITMTGQFNVNTTGTANSGSRISMTTTATYYQFNPAGSNSTYWRLYDNGTTNAVYFLQQNISNNGVYLPSGSNGWSAWSDERIKKNIEPIDTTLTNILNLNPIFYNYKGDEDTQGKRVGFIAQEVQQIYPELINESSMDTPDGSVKNLLGLEMTGLIPYMVKATQELSNQLQEAKQTIRDQDARILNLEEQIALIKQHLNM